MTATRSPLSHRRRETHRAGPSNTGNTQSDQSAELPPCLSAWNRAAGTESRPGRRCVRAQLFVQRGNCAEGSFSAGLVLPSAAEGAPRRPRPLTPSKEFTLSHGRGLPCPTRWKGGWFSWKCFYSQPNIS